MSNKRTSQATNMSLCEIEIDRCKWDERKTDARTINMLIQQLVENKTITPILVRKHGRYYRVIDGVRRILAFKKFGKERIPAYVKPCRQKTQ